MHSLLDPAWWLRFVPEILPWYVFCLVATALVLPMVLRAFRGLADRGASLATGVGLLSINWFSWLIALEWFAEGPSGKVRFVLIMAAAVSAIVALVQASRGRGPAWVLWLPCALLGVLGLGWLPHGMASVLFGAAATGAISAACWWGRWDEFRAELRRVAVPFVASQLLFLVGFLFFVNVRSYIPYATYDRGLYLAEKWGNYQHLSAIFRSTTMPPRDLWFDGAWTNYYYGGHLLTATIAKATGTAQPVAFNLGLATVFALSLSMGFGLCYSLVRLRAPRPGRIVWPQGMGWALLGGAAIALFGNLDPWRQLFTRQMDYGVQQRIERRIAWEQEEWKAVSGVPAESYLEVRSAMAAVQESEQAEALLGEIARQRSRREAAAGELEGVVARARAVVADASLPTRRKQDELLSILVPGANTPLYRLSNANSVALEEELSRLIAAGEFEDAIRQVEGIRVSGELPPALEGLRQAVESRVEGAIGGAELRAVGELLASDATAAPLAFGTGLTVQELRDAWADAEATRQLSARVQLLNQWIEQVVANTEEGSGTAGVAQALRAAIDATAIPAESMVRAALGPPPPSFPSSPNIADYRFTWENISYLDFWESSRAIKGTPEQATEEGTITEFPYFSAILGDHHPHHLALIWTLAALGACVSVLQLNARGGEVGEGAWLERSGAGLVMMALLIGYVFSVNIWDAVVLAPIYGLVVCASRWNVRPWAEWRWVGFGGFSLLLALGVAVLVNASPVVTPVFLNFKFFAVAWAALAIGIPVGLYLAPEKSAIILGGLVLASGGLLVGGAMLAPASGLGDSKLAMGFRDAVILLVAAGIAAVWTLRANGPTSAGWWYGSGFVYLVVGVVALAMTLPFKAFFVTPLQPGLEMFHEHLPPILSNDLTQMPGRFWSQFWLASPVNPFPSGLRSELGDFLLHWGLFVIPVLALMVRRVIHWCDRIPAGPVLCLLGVSLGLAALGRIYLQYWAGALSLALVPVALWLGIMQRRRVDGPIWVLAAGAFFWFWFVEALHFDDDYSGNFERYNTPFKIFYPLWPVMAGAMVVAVRGLAPRIRVKRRNAEEMLLSTGFWTTAAILGIGIPLLGASLLPHGLAQAIFFLLIVPTVGVMVVLLWDSMPGRRIVGSELALMVAHRVQSRWPALLLATMIAILGLYYPLGATVTRTREFFNWPMAGSMESRLPHRGIYTTRTLDATAHYGEYNEYRQDWKAWNWLRENSPRDAKVLERSGPDGYAPTGRIAAGSARISVLNWKHHEEQWRGRSRPAYDWLKERYIERLPLGAVLVTRMQQILPSVGAELDETMQRELRLASDGGRLKLLRSLYPEATLATLFQLRRAVELHDVSMSTALQEALNDLEKMYRSPDEMEVRRLFGMYGIRYVVVGGLEREAYGPEIADRFRRLGFLEVYNSADPKHLLQGEGEVENPTLIFEARPSFAITSEEAAP